MLNTTTVSGMRHLGTLIAAVVIGPSAWILLAFGQDRSAQAFAHAQNTALHTGDFVRPVEYLAAAGLLLGLLATLRVSPLGSVLTGLGFAPYRYHPGAGCAHAGRGAEFRPLAALAPAG